MPLPKEVGRWSLTKPREKVVKIGAKIVEYARYTISQMGKHAVPGDLFRRILKMIDCHCPIPVAPCRRWPLARLPILLRGEICPRNQ